jgi:pyruvate/2-oxoglutarate dehydrogenase complex dihydrolipoamide dehydrogenase (E3) component
MDLCDAEALQKDFQAATTACSYKQLLGASLRRKSGHCRPMKNSLGRDGIKELVKVVVSAKDDKVLGFHMVGSEASEIMQVCC